jgi:hypothetical protein
MPGAGRRRCRLVQRTSCGQLPLYDRRNDAAGWPRAGECTGGPNDRVGERLHGEGRRSTDGARPMKDNRRQIWMTEQPRSCCRQYVQFLSAPPFEAERFSRGEGAEYGVRTPRDSSRPICGYPLRYPQASGLLELDPVTEWVEAMKAAHAGDIRGPGAVKTRVCQPTCERFQVTNQKRRMRLACRCE